MGRGGAAPDPSGGPCKFGTASALEAGAEVVARGMKVTRLAIDAPSCVEMGTRSRWRRGARTPAWDALWAWLLAPPLDSGCAERHTVAGDSYDARGG